MASFPLQAGTTIMVNTFAHNELPVELISPDPVDQGASARIYQGVLRQPNESCVVALKVFPILLSRDKEVTLRRELRAVSVLSHPWILPFIGTANFGFHTIIVTPFMRNGNLLRYLKHNVGADRQRMIIQVAEAVDFLHSSAGLVHGDLKCENVLVSEQGDALLADFGLSTVINKEDSGSPTTVTAVRLQYTLRFAAPEIILGQDDSDDAADHHGRLRSKTPSSDVYAFGMLVLQAFTGNKPWPGLQGFDIFCTVFAKKAHPHPGDRAVALGLSASWWNICVKCWSYRPRERPIMPEICRELQTNIRQKRRFSGHTGPVTAVAVMPSGDRIVSGSHDGTLRIWDSESGATVVGPMTGHSDFVRSVATSPDGREIASGSDDCTIIRWDATSGAPIGPALHGHEAVVWSVCYSPDGGQILSGSEDKTLCLWEAGPPGSPAASVSMRLIFRGHQDCVWSVAFSPDASRIASGSSDATVRLWDRYTAICICIFNEGHDSAVASVAFLPDGRSLLSASWDGTVTSLLSWDMMTGQTEDTLRVPEHPHPIFALAVSPSGRHIAVGSLDDTIRVWDAKSGEPIGALFTGGQGGTLFPLAFSVDGKCLIFGGHDDTVRIWDIFV